jgi:mannose/cellobiose epimerase-like protein (N-acyl-D-glucosamine 2-epimerase family)
MLPLRPWLLDRCLPFWAETASDPKYGGFVSLIDSSAKPVLEAPKASLVQARLIYSFAHGAWLGAGSWSAEAAMAAFDFLVRHMWDGEGGGFRHLVGRDGNPEAAGADPLKDFYDHSFVLLGTAWLYRATGEPSILEWAHKTMTFLDAALADPVYGGYHEDDRREPSFPPRRQNPHMHVLEGLLALYEATGQVEWLRRAGAVVRLFTDHFHDSATGTLREFMTGDFSEAPPPAGRIREPGHHFEWTWLLLHYERLSGDGAVREAAESLYRFAMMHGVEKGVALPGVAFDEVTPEGVVLTDSKLLWPQTEALKAFVARAELLGDRESKKLAENQLITMFEHYFLADVGNWSNQLTRDGQVLDGTAPTRVLYHVVMGLSEAMRVFPEWA